MDPANRDVDSNTRSYMNRYGIDWKTDAFRDDYFSRRDFWSQSQGNGMLPDPVLFEMAFRHSVVGKEWMKRYVGSLAVEPEKQIKKGGKAA